jgi:HD-GYP domain-containing protein (c-di-GMP phosphodiesterase class II)
MTQSIPPRTGAGEWGAVMDVLHALANMITVRSHYTEGHPAIAQADEHAGAGFTGVLERMPDLVVALVDGEFIVSERPLPDLRTRLHALADAMTRHDIECIVFQRGMTREECGILGRALATQVGAPGQIREATQASLANILLRFVVRAGDTAAGSGAQTSFFVPAVADLLVGAARALGNDQPIDKLGILAVANQMVVAWSARSGTMMQRAWTRSLDDEAGHAANVAMMTAALAQDAGYPPRVCIDATAAALMHDIGHLFLPEEIRGVPEPLLDERAKAVFRNHTFAGAQMLLAAGCSPLWVAAAFEHHRGVDSGGYPTLESTAPPHELVRMIALANFYDSKRTLLQGNADEPEAALRAAMALEEKYFGTGLLRRFLRVFGVYPPGTTVELSNLEAAVVTRANAVDPWRPQVKLLRGPNAGKFVELSEVDGVAMRHRASIVRAIAPPMLVLSDVMVAAPIVAALPELDEAAEAEALLRERMRAPVAEDAAAKAGERARAQLGGMDAMLDALLTVPTHALVSAMPPAPSGFPRPNSIPVPSYAPAPQFSSRPPSTPSAAPSSPSAYSSAPPTFSTKPPAFSSAPPMFTTRPPVITTKPPVAASQPPVAASQPPPETEASLLLRLGPVTSVPVLVADVTKLSLDHRAAFVLRFLDGMSTVDDILDASGLPRVEALRILDDLLQRRVIAMR